MIKKEETISQANKNIIDLLKAENVEHYDLVENEFFKLSKIENNDYNGGDLFKKFDLDSDALILYTSGKSVKLIIHLA